MSIIYRECDNKKKKGEKYVHRLGGQICLFAETLLELAGVLLKVDDVVEIGHKSNRIRAIVESARSNRAHVAHGVADVADEHAELVHVGLIVGKDA